MSAWALARFGAAALLAAASGVIAAAQQGSPAELGNTPPAVSEPSAPLAATAAPTAATAERPPPSPEAEQLLEEVEKRHGSISVFRASFLMEKHRSLEDETEKRLGRIVVQGMPGPQRRFAVVMDQVIDTDGRGSPEKRRYVYSGGWLSEIDFDRKQLIRRQMARDGEEFDPLRAGEGPFPLPLGQRKDDVLREFHAALCEVPSTPMLQSARDSQARAISLVPREGTPIARDTASIVVCYDQETLLPVAVEVRERNGDRTTVLVRHPDASEELRPDERALLEFTDVPDQDWTKDVRPLEYQLSGPQAAESVVVPSSVGLAPSVRAALEAPWLSSEQRQDMRIEHGAWNQGDLDTPNRAVAAAVLQWKFDEAQAGDPQIDPLLLGESLLQRGQCEDSIKALLAITHQSPIPSAAGQAYAPGVPAPQPPLLPVEIESADQASRVARASLLCARALEALGRFPEAVAAARSGIAAATQAGDDPAAAAAAALAVALLGRLEGVTPAEYEAAMKNLGRIASTIDRADWRTRLAEGEILMEKHNPGEAVPALREALDRNPRCANAWYLLGRLAMMQFDFDSVERAAVQLDELAPAGPLAALLRAEAALQRKDGDLALEHLRAVLERAPAQRTALALRAAAFGLKFDEPAMRAALADHDNHASGNGRGYLEAGRALAKARQYELAAQLLEEAVRREPHYSAPRLELGLLETQTGRDDRALLALREAVKLDPFNMRAVFSLDLLERLSGWKQFESEHFIVRCQPGPDEALARDMLQPLETMHAEVAGRYQWAPQTRTTVELHPDHESFAVRISGMPSIHTIAASTGPVVAMEAPREQAPRKHLGLFDWLDVIRHEYTHTITLGATGNRIPHWLTEAVAVDMEHKVREYPVYELLARAWSTDELFDFEELNLAFVRPKRADDRALAYSQGHWMVQYMNEEFGREALPQLLSLFASGHSEAQAFAQVLEVSRGEFLAGFKEWAGDQVRDWGLAPTPSLAELASSLGTDSETPTLDDAQIVELLKKYPDHPDLLEIAIRRRLRDGAMDDAAIDLLSRYSRSRPFDSYPHRKLAEVLLKSDTPDAARVHLEALDQTSERVNAYALELVRLHRLAGRTSEALAMAQRAVRIDPYSAPTRELAATVAVEAGDLEQARVQIEALMLLEPDRAIHKQRLERIESMRAAKAH
ncbi:MAG: tetratricopeptide repeat protein [Phycisphaerales bacterium]|nr:tetratricopeptide repeat protein [Phycisphaerales bacterium]